MSLGDVLGRQRMARFVGREEPLAQFRANLAIQAGDPARRLVFSVHGDGGVGKTFLAQRLRLAAEEHGALTTYLNESVFVIPDVMNEIAAQLGRQGEPLKRFSKEYRTYRQRRLDAETARDAPPGVATFLTKAAVRAGLHAAHAVPAAGGLADLVDAQAAAKQADEFRRFLVGRFRSDQDVRLLLSPADALSPAFAEALAEAGRHRMLALFFDTYERTSLVLDDWLIAMLSERYGALPPDMVLTFVGRDTLDPVRWAPYFMTVADVPLAPFTEGEARELLAAEHVTDPRVTDVIVAVSGRLPLLVAMLAENHPADPAEVGDPSGDAVDLFLRWETDPQRRALAVAAALSRWVNEDILACLAPGGADVQALFQWLRSQPFVNSRAGRCYYHDVVRAAMIRLARGQSPVQWRQRHRMLADLHQQWRLDTCGQSGWSDPAWREHRLEEAYHRLCAAGAAALPAALAAAAEACAENETVRGQWAQMITQAGTDTGTEPVRRWGERLQAALLADDPDVAFPGALLESASLPPPARAAALRCRGRAHLLLRRHMQALADLDQAIALDPSSGESLKERGETYRSMGREGDALADFTRVIQLAPNDADAFTNRGMTYIWVAPRESGDRYHKALADFSRAIELDPGLARAFSGRGETYRRMSRHDEALQDLTRAIELDPADQAAISNRGATYTAIGRYDDAIADFNQAIGQNPANSWAFAMRGETYRQMGQLDQALDDLTGAIDLGFRFPWAIAARGLIYLTTGQASAAIADIDRAIELDPYDDYARYLRALAYRSRDQHHEAAAELGKAIELTQTATNPEGEPGTGEANLIVYRATEGDYAEAGRLTTELLARNPGTSFIRDLIGNLRDFATVADIDTTRVAELITRLEQARQEHEPRPTPQP